MESLIVNFYKNHTLVDQINFGVIDSPQSRNLVESLVLSKRLKIKDYDYFNFEDKYNERRKT